MRHRTLLPFAILLVACGATFSPDAGPPSTATVADVVPSATLPNIVLINTDDMRADLAPYLPTLQVRLADSGVTHVKAFVNSPLCCPSRTSLLTGWMQHTTHVNGNYAPSGGATTFNDASTIATDLHAAGYTTAIMGKYLNQYDLLPANYVAPGWDEWRVYYKPHYQGADLVEKAWDSTTAHTTRYTGYTPGVLRQRAVTFLQRAPLGKPVFLLLAPYAPHYEIVPPGFPVAAPQDVGHCAGIPLPPHPPSMNEADVSDKPPFVAGLPLLTAAQVARSDTAKRAQCEALLAVDRMLGDILTVLKQTNRLANTYLIWTSDNGYQLGEHRLFERKGVVYDESIRVPMIVRGPGVRLAATDTNLVQAIDLSATVRAIAGIPAGQSSGHDLRATWATGSWTTDAILLEMQNGHVPTESVTGAVRTHEYLYAEYANGFRELYDLTVDPWELNNVATSPAYQTIRASLAARIQSQQAVP